MKKKTGKKFEKLAESIFSKLIKNPNYERVEHNVLLNGVDGERQIDVLVTSQSVGIEFKTIIECRDYNKKLSISNIDGFHSKLLDVNANKGILISRKGFSSKSISKAKRLGITLCTADETEEDNWESIIDLPILFEEIHLVDLELKVTLDVNRTIHVHRDSILEINGQDMVELIRRKWSNDEFQIDYENNEQILTFPELSKPYTIKTKEVEKFELMDLQITCNIDRLFYLTSTSKLKNTQILDNITEGKRQIFVDVNSLRDTNLNVQKISREQLKQLPTNYPRIRILPHLNLEKNNFVAERQD